ncbi:MAG TPA: hypothetical protein VFB04_13055 [Terriglobales bacterium]|nr:hypothetical protein [Terriglobales bacterium]
MLAEKLMSIALSAFHLSEQERHQVTIQFLSRSLCPAQLDGQFGSGETSAVLEVSEHDLTVQKITAFVEAATPMLSESAAVKHSGPIARMLGREADPARQIAFQFNDTGSAAGRNGYYGHGVIQMSGSEAA